LQQAMPAIALLAVLSVVCLPAGVAARVFAPSTPLGAPTATIPRLSFTRFDLDSGRWAQVTQGMNVGDVDGDGRTDLVVGGNRFLVWYRNPEWTPRPIWEGYKFSAGAAVAVRDLNGDGRNDVMTGRYPLGVAEQRETVWFENTGTGWIEHSISRVAFCHDLAFADFDLDGDDDTACSDLFRNQVAWLRRPADPAAEWTTQVIDAREILGAAAADIDADGRPDVIAGRAWYRNLDASTWVRYPFTERENVFDRFFNDFAKITVLDVDGDGGLDLFVTLFANSREGEVHVFLRPRDPISEPWTDVLLDPGPLFSVHSQAAASFDGSSRVQVMVGESNVGGYQFGENPSPEIFVFRLLGAAADPTAWERILVDHHGTHEGQAVDLDGDGVPDIAGDEENTELISPPRNGQVSWWRTQVSTDPEPPQSPCSDHDPCTLDDLVPGRGCVHRPTAGAAAATCACERDPRDRCPGEKVPTSVRKRRARACKAIASATGERRDKRARREITAAVAMLGNAGKQVAKLTRKRRLSAACGRGLDDDLEDVRRRAARFGANTMRSPAAGAGSGHPNDASARPLASAR
jgi:hypothetical protein